MRILHMFPDTNYNVSREFIKFVNENFNKEKHKFVFLNSEESVLKLLANYENIELTDEKQIIKLMESCDKVILHSLFYSRSFKLKLLFSPKIMRKTFWVAWGSDLYNWASRSKSLLKYVIKKQVEYLLRKRVRYFVGVFPPDIVVFKQQFKTQAKTFYTGYVASLNNLVYRKKLNGTCLSKKRDNHLTINIQVGHSSTPVLNHDEVLQHLLKFKDENIRIFLPLSYGNAEYGDRIEELAKQMFEDKVICFREMMDIDSYMDHLSKIDIAIFNTERQIGLGNIFPLLYMQKKIYMPSNSIMFKYYNSIGVSICNYDKVINMNYDEFTKPVCGDNTQKYVRDNIINKQKKVELWRNVFDYPME